MATEYIPTFRNAHDFMTLLGTIEELAVAALNEGSDKALRGSILWSIQKLSETAAKDAELLVVAGG